MDDGLARVRLQRMNDRDRINMLERELARLQSRVSLRDPSQPRALTLLRVVAGNNIYTLGGATWTGILYSASVFTSVPTVTPTDPTTYVDGLGYGYVRINGSDIGSLVWICNGTVTGSDGTTVAGAVLNAVITNQLVAASGFVMVNCAAGGTVPVYIVSRSG